MKIRTSSIAPIIIAVILACSCKGNQTQGDNTVSLEKQSLNLQGVANARQFGGYEINGHFIKKDVLLRTANLSNASKEDLSRLHDQFHVKYVFDFRTSKEREFAPDKPVEDCKNIWLPCLEDVIGEKVARKIPAVTPKDNNSEISEIFLEIVKDSLLRSKINGMYENIVFSQTVQQHYAEVLDSLSSLPEGRSILWHCSQGKDRCGWASAFVLAALGADKKLIMEDFALSNESYSALTHNLDSIGAARSINSEEIEAAHMMAGVSIKNFENTFDEIKKRYGSLDNYLTEALHCDACQRKQLQDRFLK